MDLAPPSSFSLSFLMLQVCRDIALLMRTSPGLAVAGVGVLPTSRATAPPCAPSSSLPSSSSACSWRIGSASLRGAPGGDLTASELTGGESRPVSDGPCSASADAWARIDHGSRLAAPLGALHRVHLAVLGRWNFSFKENDFKN